MSGGIKVALSCAACVALLAACGGENGEASAPGTPVSAEDRPLEADFEDVYRVGGIVAEGWDAFTAIADLAFDASGHLYIRDDAGSSTRVVKVDGAGALVAEFGRSGDGPEEIRQAGHMVARPEGGVVIVDDGHRAYLVFGADGSFERSIRFANANTSQSAYALRVRSMREGGSLFMIRSPSASYRPVGIDAGGRVSLEVGDRTIYRVPLDDVEEAEEIPFAEGWAPSPERTATMEADDPSDMFGMIGEAFAYFEPGLVFDVLPGGGVAYSDSSAYAIKIRMAAGTPARVVSRPLQPEPVTEGLRERVRERELEVMESSLEGFDAPSLDNVSAADRAQVTSMVEGLKASLRDVVANMRFMPEVPLVRDLRTTWDGRIWVERWGSDPIAQVSVGSQPAADVNAEGWIDVLDPDAGYVGTFTMAETRMPRAFGPGGLVAFVEMDEFDVPTVIVRRLPETVH